MLKDKLKINKKRVFVHLFLVIIPLVCGLLIYVFSDTETYISSLVSGFVPFTIISFEKRGFFAFLRNYFCDFCWAFSLESCISLILPKLRSYFTVSVLVSFVLSVLLEMLQVFSIISGIFDFVDIGIETVAIFAAGFTIYYLIWRDIT